MRRAVVAAACLAIAACGGEGPATPPLGPPPTADPSLFEVQLVSVAPAAGAALQLSAPNNTPVTLQATFSITVGTGRPGTYYWTTAVQAADPLSQGRLMPVVTTAPHVPVALAPGSQTLVFSSFHTTNAVCYAGRPYAPVSASLDIEVKTSPSFSGPAFYGRQFPVSHALACNGQPPAPTTLAIPVQLSPAPGQVFDHFPRTTTLQWSAVPGARSYGVELEVCQPPSCAASADRTFPLTPPFAPVDGTSLTFDFVGAQPGRWRVRATGVTGLADSPWSGWSEFVYRR
jgi:hypothetical protein